MILIDCLYYSSMFVQWPCLYSLSRHGFTRYDPKYGYCVCSTRSVQDAPAKQNHFGRDDPRLWPQPFDKAAGHLAVIPSPQVSDTQPLYWAWYQPLLSNFLPFPVVGLSGMVQLSMSVQEHMMEMCATISASVLSLDQDLQHDRLLTQTCDQLRKYLEQLGEPNCRNVAALQLACVQRMALELHSQVQWLWKWLPWLYEIDSHFEVDPTIMGAFTRDLDVASNLFRVGIPMWLIHPLHMELLTHIDSIVAPLNKDLYQQLPIRDSPAFFFDASDCIPANPTIYTGLPGHYKRYSHIVNYIKEQFSSGLVESFQIQNEVLCMPGSLLPQVVAPVAVPTASS